MLGIGLVVSLFSAMFISRLFILVVAKKKNLNLNWFLGIK
jgi:preprotein translocase subunit SecD